MKIVHKIVHDNVVDFPPKKKKAKKAELPKYVIVDPKTGNWYVRRNFPTDLRDSKGRVVYIQIKRRCEPRTKAHAEHVSLEIEIAYRQGAC
jgi:hypothetical protein